jgi:hypothetical protein
MGLTGHGDRPGDFVTQTAIEIILTPNYSVFYSSEVHLVK